MLNEEKLARRARGAARRTALETLNARGEHRFRMQLGALGRVLHVLGNPERRFRSLLIAGTNGKGSVSAICDAISRAAGMRTGFYSSPHLVDVGERVRLDGRLASVPELERWLSTVLEAEDVACRRVSESELSYFELLTAAAFVAFHEAGVELAVLEVGLGGRLDATNAAAPAVTVITNVGLDHEAVLGDTREQIAHEKAGILRPATPLVTAVDDALFESTIAARCSQLGVPVRRLGRDVLLETCAGGEAVVRVDETSYRLSELALRGRFQHANTALAIAAMREIGVSRADVVERALRDVEWPGRLEWLKTAGPPVLVDVAHNPDGARVLASFLDEHPEMRWHAVFAVQQGKNWRAMLAEVAPRCAELICCPLPHPGGLDPGEALDWARAAGHAATLAASPEDAFERARAAASNGSAAVLVFGSHYLVGPLRQRILSQRSDAGHTCGGCR